MGCITHAVPLAVFAYFNSAHGLHYARSAVFLVLIVIQWVNALLMRGSESVGKILRVHNHAFNMAIVMVITCGIIELYKWWARRREQRSK